MVFFTVPVQTSLKIQIIFFPKVAHKDCVFKCKHTLQTIYKQQLFGLEACNRYSAEFLLLQGQKELL